MFSVFIFGQKDKEAKVIVEKASIYLIDQTEIDGEIDFPLIDDEKPLKIKNTKGKQKIDRNQIKKVVFITNKGTTEYVTMSVYNETNSKILKIPKLLIKILEGKISMYVSSYDNNQFSFNASTNSFGNNAVGFTNFYCLRTNEQAASLIHVESNFANKNIFFRQNGKKYFADNAEIANKIDSREYTFKNLFEVVSLYNSLK